MQLRRLYSTPQYTVDQYGPFAWATLYSIQDTTNVIEAALQREGINSAIKIFKNKTGAPDKPEFWFGYVPETVTVEENGVLFEVRCQNTFHPGLFLDHQITRETLKEISSGKTLLNLFSYTGSLAIAAAVGGATKTISIDLSNPSTQWAKKNAELNHLNPEQHQFIKGDVFDWTKRFKKKNQTFDIVVSDPPSQSRSDEMHFSTQKHLDLLHELCITCVAPGGILFTSINTETISEKVMMASTHNVAEKLGRKIKRYDRLVLPEGFDNDFRSMKGIRIDFAN